jgi:glutathione synthase/RimK-type ligase-like ATP-grasp enzyme
LDELVEQGIYCQLKPSSFYILSNKPFLYTTLNAKGVKISKTSIFGHPEQVDTSLKDFSFPLILKTFLGAKKTQVVLIDSNRTLKSVLKSIAFDIDALTIQEYLEGDLDQSIVIGDDVFTVKRKWIEKELSHSKNALSSKLSEDQKEMAIKAARLVGADIATVKMINGTVIGVRAEIDFKMFNEALSEDIFEKIARFFKEKIKGES